MALAKVGPKRNHQIFQVHQKEFSRLCASGQRHFLRRQGETPQIWGISPGGAIHVWQFASTKTSWGGVYTTKPLETGVFWKYFARFARQKKAFFSPREVCPQSCCGPSKPFWRRAH